MKVYLKKDLKQLANHITDSYAGDYASVSRDLNKAIYCLHFLKKDEIPRDEVQDLCFALHKLGECFYQIHSSHRRYEQQTFRKTLKKIREVLSR